MSLTIIASNHGLFKTPCIWFSFRTRQIKITIYVNEETVNIRLLALGLYSFVSDFWWAYTREGLYTGGGGAYTWTIFCVSNKQISHKQGRAYIPGGHTGQGEKFAWPRWESNPRPLVCYAKLRGQIGAKHINYSWLFGRKYNRHVRDGELTMFARTKTKTQTSHCCVFQFSLFYWKILLPLSW